MAFPHIVFLKAKQELDANVLNDITKKGFVAVPTDVYLLMCKEPGIGRRCWEHFEKHSAGLLSIPAPGWRPALREWEPESGNPYSDLWITLIV